MPALSGFSAGCSILAAAFWGTLLAQTNAPAPRSVNLAARQATYEVVSIKPARRGTWTSGPAGRFGPDGRFTALAATVASLIQRAYTIPSPAVFQLRGLPDWASNEGFAIEAKPVSGAPIIPLAQAKLMLQALLADRFKLAIKRETLPVSGFELVVAKDGFKLQPSPAPALGPAGFLLPGGPITVGQFSSRLTVGADGYHPSLTPISANTAIMNEPALPVIDKTGLQGSYNFYSVLGNKDRWTSATAGGDGAETVSQLLTRKLGLALVKAKVPMAIYTVTHVERPTPNGSRVADIEPAAFLAPRQTARQMNRGMDRPCYPGRRSATMMPCIARARRTTSAARDLRVPAGPGRAKKIWVTP